MRDPRRLLDGDASELERSLLGAAQAELAPAAAQERLLAQLGLGAIAAGGSSAPASAQAAGSPSLPAGPGAAGASGLAGKLLITALVGAAVGGGLWSALPRSAPMPTRERASSGSTPIPTPGVTAPAEHASAPNEPVATPGDAAPSALSREVAELAAVRARLRAGEARAALSALADYARARPHAVLAQEADALRVEALLLAGEQAAARAEAGRFLRAHPDSPHTARLKALLRAPPAER